VKLQEAQHQFIQSWGQLGASWGINKTMAQIHAVLLLSNEALSTDDVMERLNISRGNANMNLRELIHWGIIHKEFKPGERKEFFNSEKSIWDLATQVAKERKRRELDPLLKMLDQVKEVEGPKSEVKLFKQVTGEVGKFAKRAENLIEFIIKMEEKFFFRWMKK
jgi:DNA-binding transcriptional regulator GbsR (MarR family)